MFTSVLASRHSLLGRFQVSFSGLQAHANPHTVTLFDKHTEVRVLSSTGVTRHQRSYDPVRPPPAPPPCGDVEAATLVPNGHPPITRLTFRTCRAHYPDGPERVRLSVATPSHTGLPRISGGSASMTSLSRPAQTSLALRPAGLLNRLCGLCHEASIRPVARPNRSSATRSYRQLNVFPFGIVRIAS